MVAAYDRPTVKAWGAHLLACLVTLVAAVAAVGCGGSEGDGYDPPFSAAHADALLKRLDRGHNVLLLRHAATDTSTDQTADFEDCSRQRNLSGEGRRQARRIGRALRRLRIDLENTLTSWFCRARDTGQLIAGQTFRTRALLPPDVLDTVRRDEDPSDYSLAGLLRGWSRNAGNTLMVSHESTILDAIGEDLDEGETVIVTRAPGRKGFRVGERLTPADWEWLARSR
jgi:phosphohistidine phosphatase SixA